MCVNHFRYGIVIGQAGVMTCHMDNIGIIGKPEEVLTSDQIINVSIVVEMMILDILAGACPEELF